MNSLHTLARAAGRFAAIMAIALLSACSSPKSPYVFTALTTEVSMKGEAIGRAIGIVEGLRDALNMDAGGEVARNLDELYEYAAQRLLEGNLRNDVACLDEIAALLVEIQGAWEAIAPRPATPGHAP